MSTKTSKMYPILIACVLLILYIVHINYQKMDNTNDKINRKTELSDGVRQIENKIQLKHLAIISASNSSTQGVMDQAYIRNIMKKLEEVKSACGELCNTY